MHIAPGRFEAALFDMDGVITDTASLHAACWKTTFDEFLAEWSAKTSQPFREFGPADYKSHVDGKPRFQGVRDFLKARGISLPEGKPDDAPSHESICGIGNRKNQLVNERLATVGAEAYPGTVALIMYLRRVGFKVAVVTSSQNCHAVLQAAGVADLFDAIVDGDVLVKKGLSGKPAPDSFLQAAEMLEVSPQHAVVVEDAIAGVQAGARGGFGLVIGVARKDDANELRAQGADLVVNDLAELLTGKVALPRDRAA